MFENIFILIFRFKIIRSVCIIIRILEGNKIKNPLLSGLRAFKVSFEARWREVSLYVVFLLVALLVTTLTSGANLINLGKTSAILVPAWVFLGLAMYSFNDLFDEEVDEKNDRDLPLSSGKAKKSEIMTVILISSLISTFLTSILGLKVLLACLVCIGLGIMYSAPPVELKRRIFGKPIVVCMGNLFSYVAGVFSLGSFNPLHLFILLFMGVHYFLSASVTDLRDVEGDKLDNRSNLPLLIGRKRTADIVIVSFAILPFSALIGYIYFGFNLMFIFLLGLLAALNISKLLKYRYNSRRGNICGEAIIRVFLSVYTYPVVFALGLL